MVHSLYKYPVILNHKIRTRMSDQHGIFDAFDGLKIRTIIGDMEVTT